MNLSLERLCIHLTKLLHTTVDIYLPEGEKIAEYGRQQGQADIFDADPEFLKMLLQMSTERNIYIYIESNSILYAAISKKETDSTLIIGPYCFDGDSSKEIFDESILLAYELLSGETLEPGELYAEHSNILPASETMAHSATQIFYHYREDEHLHNSYGQELREQEAIRTGDVLLLKESRAEGYKGKLGTLASNPLRNRKNLGISCVAISARSAIAGGVSSERAFTFSDAVIQKLEQATSIPEIDVVVTEAQMYLTRMVHELNNNARETKQSPLVEEAKLLITKNLHSKISIASLAKELKVSPSGLYKAFQREENMTVSNYVLKSKINAAKERLMYSEDTYGEIAACYGFSNQSHFGQTFKKFVGMTPGEYRKKYGKY